MAAAVDLVSGLRRAHTFHQYRTVQPAPAAFHLLRAVRGGGAQRNAGRGDRHRTRAAAGRQEEVGMAATGTAVKRNVVGVDGSDSPHHAGEWDARPAEALGSEGIAVYALAIPRAPP